MYETYWLGLEISHQKQTYHLEKSTEFRRFIKLKKPSDTTLTVNRYLNLAGKLHGCHSLFTLCENPFDSRHFNLLGEVAIAAAILRN